MDARSGSGYSFERSARTDFRVWALLIVGLIFVYAGYSIDPRDNCDESGNCAPWLVPVAAIMGLAATAGGLGQLWANPRRGSRIDPQRGELIWWNGRTTRSEGDGGQIAFDRIARIDLGQNREDGHVSLYDQDGERQPYFDQEVIPWPADKWVDHLRHCSPHLIVDNAPS